jgi:TolA-binding protein
MYHANHTSLYDDSKETPVNEQSIVAQTTGDETAGTSKAITRRGVLGGALAAGLMTVGIAGFAGAQSTTGTPAASPAETPDTESDDTIDARTEETDDIASRVEEEIEQASNVITSVTADRDAVISQLEPETIDELLDQATSLLDSARDAADAEEDEQALRLAWGASATARTARQIIIAQQTYAGLPSQEAAASRVLANAHEAITTVIEEVDTAGDTDVSFYVTTAQELYENAYARYTSEAYAQAAAKAKAATELAWIPLVLTDTEGGFGSHIGRRVGPDHGPRGGFNGPAPGPDRDRLSGSKEDEPVTVPEPNF